MIEFTDNVLAVIAICFAVFVAYLYKKDELYKLVYVFSLGVMFIGLAQAEIEKKAEASAYHQKLLDVHIASVTTKHKVTCNDDIIEGWCAKYNMNKVDFEKENN